MRDAAAWNQQAYELLTGLVQIIDRDNLNATQQALYPHLIRIRRYLVALRCLSFRNGDKDQWVFLIDGAHAINKSLFETYIEHALCLTHIEIFPACSEAGETLAQRLYRYSDLKKREKNYRRLQNLDEKLAQIQEMGVDLKLSPGMEAFRGRGRDRIKEDLIEQARHMEGLNARFKDLNHWFPERGPDGLFFCEDSQKNRASRPSGCGSMAWRCKAVLAKSFPIPGMRRWWISAYDDLYDEVNLLTHPALGYDDNFRPEAERLLDLADHQTCLRITFHQCVMPSLRACFSKQWLGLVALEDQLQITHEKASKVLAAFSTAIRSTDYRQPGEAGI